MLRTATLLILLVSSPGVALAQTSPPEAEEDEQAEAQVQEQEAQEQEAQEQEAEPSESVADELPEIDVWAEDDDDQDVFDPTERISADSSIAFPVDI